MDHDILTSEELAERFRIKVKSLAKMRDRPVHIMVRNVVRYRLVDVVAWEAEKAATPKPPPSTRLKVAKVATYLTTRQLSERWDVSVPTLAAYRARRTGVPFTKLGTHVRYLIEDVVAYEKAHTVEPLTISSVLAARKR